MKDVHTHIARFGYPHEGIEISPIQIDQATFLMDRLGNRLNVQLEDAEGIRIRDHQRRHLFVHHLLHRVRFYDSSIIGGNLHHLIAA